MMLEVTVCWYVILLTTDVQWCNFIHSVSLIACSWNVFCLLPLQTFTDIEILLHWGPIKSQLELLSKTLCFLTATTRVLPLTWHVWQIITVHYNYTLKGRSYFFITVSSRRSILFCTRTVGMSPTSISTFSLQLLMASNDSLSVVEKTSTQAWAPTKCTLKENGTKVYLIMLKGAGIIITPWSFFIIHGGVVYTGLKIWSSWSTSPR